MAKRSTRISYQQYVPYIPFQSEPVSPKRTDHGVAIVRLIFQLPARYQISELFVYIECFSDLDDCVDNLTGMYRVRRCFLGLKPVSMVVPLSHVWRSCHLVPDFADRSVHRSTNMIDVCNTFFINPYIDSHVFRVLHT